MASLSTASPSESTTRSEAQSIIDAFACVRAGIAAEAEGVGRPAPILTAVSKTQPDTAIEAALAAGQRVFGENRVQEAYGRWAERRPAHPDLELRLIGPLQTNKVADALDLFDVIETLDRDKLARVLADDASRRGTAPRVLIQVNTGEEPQKAGVTPRDLDAFVQSVRGLGLGLEGLMCIPPVDEPPALHFALLAKLAARNGLGVLSMGMSGDWPVAVRLGATHVRIGSALFGARDTA